VLGRIEPAVPQLPLAVVIAACIASIVSFLYLIAHLGRRLRPVTVVTDMGHTGARVIESMYPQLLAASPEAESRPGIREGEPRQVVRSRAGGVVLAFDLAGLGAAARSAGGGVELGPRGGGFGGPGGPPST